MDTARHARSLAAYAGHPVDLSPDQALRRLAGARVVVLGCGGLGGHVIDLLARSGIGTLRLVDDDVFTGTNLNRQLLCTTKSLGRPKALAAFEHVRLVNPEIAVDTRMVRATAANMDTLLAGMDLVVDALDSIPARFLLARAAGDAGIPLMHGAVAGFLGHATTIFPHETTLHSLYPDPDACPLQDETGVAPPLPALVASVQAGEVLKFVLGHHGGLLRGKLWLCDLAAPYMGIHPLEHFKIEML